MHTGEGNELPLKGCTAKNETIWDILQMGTTVRYWPCIFHRFVKSSAYFSNTIKKSQTASQFLEWSHWTTSSDTSLMVTFFLAKTEGLESHTMSSTSLGMRNSLKWFDTELAKVFPDWRREPQSKESRDQRHMTYVLRKQDPLGQQGETHLVESFSSKRSDIFGCFSKEWLCHVQTHKY